MSRKKTPDEFIRIEVPPHLRKGACSERALHLLCEARKRNLHNSDYIDHITIREVRNTDGSVHLFPLVIAKPLPAGCHGSLVWTTAIFTRQPRFAI